MDNNRKFIGGSGVYKQMSKSGWDASSYSSAWKKKKDEEAKTADFSTGSSNSAKAATVKKNKNLFDNIGDFLGGAAGFAGDVGKTVGEGVGGAVNFAGETVKGIGGIFATDEVLKKEAKYQVGEEAIRKHYKQEEDDKVWKGYENAKSVDELPADRQKIWNDIQAKRKEDIAGYTKSADEQGYDSKNIDKKTKDLLNEQSRNSKAFTEAGRKTYQLAQYIPGVSLGAEGVGTLASMATGDDGDINKGLISLTQGKDWDKLSDEEKKQALIQRNIGGTLSTLDLAGGAGRTLKAGLKVGTKEGLKAGAKAASEAYGKSIAKQTIGDVAGVGAKELTKQAGKSAAVGGVMGGVLGAGLGLASGSNDILGNAIEGAKGGVIGGALGSPLDVSAGKAGMKQAAKDADIKKAEVDAKAKQDAMELEQAKLEADQADSEALLNYNRNLGLNDDGTRNIDIQSAQKELEDLKSGNYSEDMYDITSQDGKSVSTEDIQMATNKQLQALTARRDSIASQVDSIEDPAARELAMMNVNRLDDQISSISSGDSNALLETAGAGMTKTLNTQKVKERFSQLQNDVAEYNFRNKQPDDKYNQPSKTLDDISKEIEAVGAGGIAPEAVTPRENFVAIGEIAATKNMPMAIRSRANVLARDIDSINKLKSNVMTDDRAESILNKMDAKYNADMERINSMPEVRRVIEAEKIEAKYNESFQAIQSQKEADADKAFELRRMEEQIRANIAEVMSDANTIKNNNPAEFGTVDDALNKQIAAEIEKDTGTAIFNHMSNEGSIADSENLSKVWADSPDELLDERVLGTPEVSELMRSSLQDTFDNDGVKLFVDALRSNDKSYTALAYSSPSTVLDNAFGDVGKQTFTGIAKGYSETNKANVNTANELASIQKGLHGDVDLNEKLVDTLEDKDPDVSMLNAKESEAFEKTIKLRDRATRMVKVIAFRDKLREFSGRVNNKNIKYTNDEITALAKRDGIDAESAKAKYGEIEQFNKSDISYLATQHSNKSTLANYFPHLFNKKSPEIAKFVDSMATTNGEITFKNLLHREKNNANYSKDVVEVFATYMAGLNKKMYLEPALLKLDDAKFAVKVAEGDSAPLAQFLENYEKQVKNNEVSGIGKSYNELIDKRLAKKDPNNPKIGDNHYRALLSTQRQINSVAALGLSFRNAIQQVSQLGSSIGKVGTANMIVGMTKYMTKRLTSKSYRDVLEERAILNAGISKEAYSEMLDQTRGGKIKKAGDKIADKFMFMTTAVDEFARGSTYEASLHEHLKLGKSMDEADELAVADAAMTNFLTSKIDMPLKLNKDGVRSLTQFMTFSYKQAEAWKKLGINAVKNPETGKYQFRPKEMFRLVQMLALYGLAFGAMEEYAGIDLEDNIPFYGNIFGDSGIPRSPLVSLLAGDGKKPGLIETLDKLGRPEGNNEIEKEASRQEMLENFGNILIKNFVPGGNQMKKSYEGYQSTENDGVVEKDGQVRYIQGTDDATKLKATLFGQYSTDQGKEWVNKQFPTLSEKESEILNAQKDKESKQRAYDFYGALKSTQLKSALGSDLKELMKSQPAKAKRIIQTHNDEVRSAVDEYTSQYGDMTEYQKNYILSKYYITQYNVDNYEEQ